MKAQFFIYRSKDEIYCCRLLTRESCDKTYKISSKAGTNLDKDKLEFKCSGLQFHLFLNELDCCPSYRLSVIRSLKGLGPNKELVIFLDPSGRQFLDYRWGAIINYLVWETLEMEYLMSWLSTLGGAFSSLGDSKTKCAEIAGKISVHQLKLAMTLGNPSMVARCRLFMSISLIQRKRFKLAKHLIRQQYDYAKAVDDNLVRKMCFGIWSKLQYSHKLSRQNKINKL